MPPLGSASAWGVALAPVAGLAADVVVQVAVFRLAPGRNLLRSIVVGFGAGLLVGAGLTLRLLAGTGAAPAELAGALACNAVTGGALGYGYFHFVNLTETARRIRMLWELSDAGVEGLTRADLHARYGAARMVDARLGRLLGKGQVRREGDRLLIARPLVLRMAQTVGLVKRLLFGAAAAGGAGIDIR